jgi:hypothetical protein
MVWGLPKMAGFSAQMFIRITKLSATTKLSAEHETAASQPCKDTIKKWKLENNFQKKEKIISGLFLSVLWSTPVCNCYSPLHIYL